MTSRRRSQAVLWNRESWEYKAAYVAMQGPAVKMPGWDRKHSAESKLNPVPDTAPWQVENEHGPVPLVSVSVT